MTSIGRRPQNIKSGIYQKPLFGSYSISKLKLRSPIFYKSFKLRQLSMEDDLKILKVEYLSNHLLDHAQILNLSLVDQTIFYKSFK